MTIKLSKKDGATVVVEAPKAPAELAGILSAINKKKPNTIYYGIDIPPVARLATGVFEFDHATMGGFPYGRISIIYGPESSGKSNLCYCAAATAQRRTDGCNKVIWVDLEGTFDKAWAALFGVNIEELIIVRPGYGEEAVDLVDALVRAGDVALVVIDSIATMVSAKEVGQTVETMDVQGISTLVKRLTNKLAVALSEEWKRGHAPAVIYINQTRFKIGVMFGDPETMPGGQTMKFLSSLTVRVYGKNKMVKEISSDLAAFKETHAVIKKAKVPVLKMAFDYDLCMMAHDGLNVGESNSFNLVKTQLQNLGHLVKGNKGWELLGATYPKLEIIQDTYMAEKEFAIKLQGLVIAGSKEAPILIEQEPEAPYVQKSVS